MSKQQCNKYKVLLITFGSPLKTIFFKAGGGGGANKSKFFVGH